MCWFYSRKENLTMSDLDQIDLKLLEMLQQSGKLTTKEIAQQLYLSPYTIDSHRKRMMERLQVKNTAGLIRMGFQNGFLN